MSVMAKQSRAAAVAMEAATSRLYDSDGFTYDYQEYAAPLTEAPEVYHSFAALAILSAVIGRKLYLPFGARNLYPNVWIALVGKSSQLKKSTALRIAQDVISAVDKTLLLPDDFSGEALYDAFAKQGDGIFIWNELGAVLKAFEKNYMTGVKELLTELFDCPDEKVKKLKSGDVTIKDACPSAFCASTVDWLNGNLSQSDLRSGFAARFVFVPAQTPSKVLPFPPRRNDDLRDLILRDLGLISQLSGEMILSDDAREIYEVWYREMHDTIKNLPDSSRVHAFASRLESYALKFSMLYQVAHKPSSTSPVIEGFAMELGCNTVDWLFDEVTKLVDGELACSDREREVREVADYIRSGVVVKHSALLRAFRKHKARDLADIVTSLTESEQVAKEYLNKSQCYRWTGGEAS